MTVLKGDSFKGMERGRVRSVSTDSHNSVTIHVIFGYFECNCSRFSSSSRMIQPSKDSKDGATISQHFILDREDNAIDQTGIESKTTTPV